MKFLNKIKMATACSVLLGFSLISGTASAGPIILSGMDPEDHGAAGATMIADLLTFVVVNSSNLGTTTDILILGPGGPIGASGTDASLIAVGLGFSVDVAATPAAIAAADFSDYKALYMPTADRDITGGLTVAQLTAINFRGADIVAHVNTGGGLTAFAQNIAGGYAWFPLGGLATLDFGAGGAVGVTVTGPGSLILAASATVVTPFHTAFTGGLFGLDVLAVDASGRPLIIGGDGDTIITPTPGVPEPSILLLLVIGLLGLPLLQRRRNSAS